jgi:hypothetical protein
MPAQTNLLANALSGEKPYPRSTSSRCSRNLPSSLKVEMSFWNNYKDQRWRRTPKGRLRRICESCWPRTNAFARRPRRRAQSWRRCRRRPLRAWSPAPRQHRTHHRVINLPILIFWAGRLVKTLNGGLQASMSPPSRLRLYRPISVTIAGPPVVSSTPRRQHVEAADTVPLQPQNSSWSPAAPRRSRDAGLATLSDLG